MCRQAQHAGAGAAARRRSTRVRVQHAGAAHGRTVGGPGQQEEEAVGDHVGQGELVQQLLWLG